MKNNDYMTAAKAMTTVLTTGCGIENVIHSQRVLDDIQKATTDEFLEENIEMFWAACRGVGKNRYNSEVVGKYIRKIKRIIFALIDEYTA